MIAGDQLLRDALAGLGGSGIVALDELDLDARRQVLLVRLDVEIDALLHLVASLGEKSRIAVDQADPDGLRRCCGAAAAIASAVSAALTNTRMSIIVPLAEVRRISNSIMTIEAYILPI